MKKITWMVAVLVVALSAGVTFAGWFSEDTVGEWFRKQIAKIRKDCASRKLDRGEVCGGVAQLKPADPLATEEGRFAHSIVVPNPLPADSGYKTGMTSKEYFDHLCKTEAGEFIYKTVDNVEGLFMMRPRTGAMDDYLQEHLYALEDPYGHMDAEAQAPEFFFVRPVRYTFLEHPVWPDVKPPWSKRLLDPSYFVPPNKAARYERFTRSEGPELNAMVKEYVSERKARYGYTWRGITRPNDRELGIAGGELIVLNLETKEVLGVRRGFIRSGWMKNSTGIWWMTGQACPRYASMGGRSRDFDFAYWFISQVLKPAAHEQRGKESTDVK